MNKVYDKLIVTPPGMVIYLCITLIATMIGMVGDVFTDVEHAAKMLYTVLTLIGVCAVYTASIKLNAVKDGYPVVEIWRSSTYIIQHAIAATMLSLPLLGPPIAYMFSASMMRPVELNEVTVDAIDINYLVTQGFDIETSEQIARLNAAGRRSAALQLLNDSAEQLEPRMEPIKRFRATRLIMQ